MIWYKYLYAEQEIRHKKEKIKWKISHNAGQLNIYVVALAANEDNLLEIISSLELMQRGYPRDRLFVVGLARGYEQARELACGIILETYENTGDFKVREYLLSRHRASEAGAGL